MASAAAPLLHEMKRRFYPFVLDRGFRRLRSDSPQYSLWSRTLPARSDIFEIQWDKYWRPYFVLNFGRTVSSSESSTEPGRLQRRRGGDLSCWFSLRRPLLSKVKSLRWSYRPSEVIDELIGAFDELEVWWAEGRAGPHVYVYALHA